MSEEAILDQLFMSCVTENDTAPVEDIITKVRGVVSAENQVSFVMDHRRSVMGMHSAIII